MADRPLTPTMVACLKLVGKNPGVYIPWLAHQCAPREPYGWSAQGAARMGGKLAKALERRGLVRRSHFVTSGVGQLYLTKDGEAELLRIIMAEENARLLERSMAWGAVDESAQRYFSDILGRA